MCTNIQKRVKFIGVGHFYSDSAFVALRIGGYLTITQSL